MAQDYSVLGKRLPRVDAFEKATGRAVYAADIYLPGMLYGKSLRSPYSHAKIVNIDTSRAQKLPGVKAVLTYKDLASGQVLATNDMAHGMKLAQELFASEKVRYQGQKIAVVAATDPDIAEDALDLIHVEFEELKPVFGPDGGNKAGRSLGTRGRGADRRAGRGEALQYSGGYPLQRR